MRNQNALAPATVVLATEPERAGGGPGRHVVGHSGASASLTTAGPDWRCRFVFEPLAVYYALLQRHLIWRGPELEHELRQFDSALVAAGCVPAGPISCKARLHEQSPTPQQQKVSGRGN